ncbi:tyrosine-type recombinase/integrase [Domibacillus sp. A3M-37]|uniref:tyrosine-type recombinase/integrase n=1 Tax=Domibacillus sp. A3M-37 TaxID=2962037 RepID=UPI0020B8BEB5|nr:tyrosine-type recombinase/integrase [Domibacillus sp. A3M-37]MCP3764856.1 tyrosine-type recombinase/integrase [Domibacillus sp. A3M-37]
MPCIPIKDKKTIDDMMEVLASRPNGFTYALYLEFALSTALRVSDILALKKKDIKNGVVYVKTQKTGVVKHIALNDKCRAKMEMYLEHKKENDVIFDFTRQWVHQMLKWAADMVGMDKSLVSCHTTRKTAAWRFYVASGHDIVKTGQLLGHKSSTETRKYLGIDETEVNDLNAKISWS